MLLYIFLARYFPSPYFCCLFPSASIYISLSPRHGPSSPLNTLFTIIGVEGPIGLNISHYSPHRRICVTLDTRRHAGGGCWISRTNVGTITLITACCRQPSAQSWTAHSANTALSVLGQNSFQAAIELHYYYRYKWFPLQIMVIVLCMFIVNCIFCSSQSMGSENEGVITGNNINMHG